MQAIQLDFQGDEDIANALKAQTASLRLDIEAAEQQAATLQVATFVTSLDGLAPSLANVGGTSTQQAGRACMSKCRLCCKPQIPGPPSEACALAVTSRSVHACRPQNQSGGGR